MYNRRQSVRVPVSARGAITADGYDYPCRLLDLSAEGVGTTRPLGMSCSTGLYCEVHMFDLPGIADVQLGAELVYIAGERLGFRVIKIPQWATAPLKSIISQSAIDNALVYDRRARLDYDG